MEDYQRRKLEYFRESLTRLARPAEEQRAWLRENRLRLADELATAALAVLPDHDR